MKVLIVEDERNLAEIIKQGLEENSIAADIAFDGEDGLFMAETYPYDAVILDVMLPGMDGFTVLEKLRKKMNNVPVLMLTVRSGVEDRVKGLNTGADDYLLKPFDFPELLARLRAIIRRSKGEASPVIKVEDLTIDINTRTVRRGDRKVQLTDREYKILEHLALNRGRIITRDALTGHIYDMDSGHDSNVIDVYINYLRNKIDRGFRKKLIYTIRGAGYTIK